MRVPPRAGPRVVSCTATERGDAGDGFGVDGAECGDVIRENTLLSVLNISVGHCFVFLVNRTHARVGTVVSGKKYVKRKNSWESYVFSVNTKSQNVRVKI
jgi:hypothetical protein